MKRLALLLPLLALAAAPARAEDPATNAPAAFRATILGDRPAGPYLVSNRVARLRDTFGLPSPSGLRSAFDARSAPEGAVAERSFREEAGGTVSIRRERFLVPLSELPAERAFSDGFRVRLEPADGPAAPPPAEEDVSVFEEWHAALTGPAEPPPEGVSPAVFLARRQMDPFGPPDEFEFSLGYRNHPALPEGTNIVWAGWLRSEQGAGFIEQSWPVRMNGQRLEIGHSGNSWHPVWCAIQEAYRREGRCRLTEILAELLRFSSPIRSNRFIKSASFKLPLLSEIWSLD